MKERERLPFSRQVLPYRDSGATLSGCSDAAVEDRGLGRLLLYLGALGVVMVKECASAQVAPDDAGSTDQYNLYHDECRAQVHRFSPCCFC